MGDGPDSIIRSKVWLAELGKNLFKQACETGLEGIVSKNLRGRYLAGLRRDWVKSKCRARQEFVVCGYSAPKGSLEGFGAMVLGSFEKGRLVPRGRVGTGFSDKDRLRLLETFRPLKVLKAPFPSKEKDVQWLEPRLVAEVEFAELTTEGAVRQGSFIALREDKPAAEVHLDPLQTASAEGKDVRVAGIVISHPERPVYPADQVSKLEVARYFEQVAELMLPFVANHPLALLRDFLAGIGLSTMVITSGGKGLHIVLHLKKNHKWDLMKEFTKTVAQAVAQQNLQRFTITSTKSKRSGKIYIDWMRNGRGATCIAPWCLRARAGATVSMPVNWENLYETAADQYTIRHPPIVPSEWMDLKPQTITKAMLRQVGME